MPTQYATSVPPMERGPYRYTVCLTALLLLLVLLQQAAGAAGEPWLAALGVGLPTSLLVIWLWRVDRRSWMRQLSVVLLILVVAGGTIPGITVLTEVALCLSAYLAFALSTAWMNRVIYEARPVRIMRRLCLLSLVLLFGRGFVGQILQQSEGAQAQWIHLGFGLTVSLSILAAVAYSSAKYGDVPGFRRMNRISLLVLGLQIALFLLTLTLGLGLGLGLPRPDDLGGTASLSLFEAGIQSVYGLLTSALFLLPTILAARSYRNLVPRSPS